MDVIVRFFLGPHWFDFCVELYSLTVLILNVLLIYLNDKSSQMRTRAGEVFGELVGKSRADKGIGVLLKCDTSELMDKYFDSVLVFGFDKFFPEIFLDEGGPLRHKCWREQPTYTDGEKVVRRFVMRFVRWLCEVPRVLPNEPGGLDTFPVFEDWIRQAEKGTFSRLQHDSFAPAHLRSLGWYIESEPGDTEYFDARDKEIYDNAELEIQRVREAPLSEKYAVLEETLEVIKEGLAASDSDGVTPVGMVDRYPPSLSYVMICALSGKTNIELYVPLTNPGIITEYGPIMLYELQELINISKDLDTMHQDDLGVAVADVVRSVEAMAELEQEAECVITASTPSSSQPAAPDLIAGHYLRPRVDKPTPDEPVSSAPSQKKLVSKPMKKPTKLNPDDTPVVKFKALQIDGAEKSLRHSMNLSIEGFYLGIRRSVFQKFMGCIREARFLHSFFDTSHLCSFVSIIRLFP